VGTKLKRNYIWGYTNKKKLNTIYLDHTAKRNSDITERQKVTDAAEENATNKIKDIIWNERKQKAFDS
jgi:hypothetical protein